MLGALWQQVKDELIKRRSSFSRHFLPHHLFVANDYYSLTFFLFARLRLISLKGILFLSLFCFSFFWKTKQQVVNVTLCTLLACLTRLKVSKSPKNKLHPVWSSEVIFVFVETRGLFTCSILASIVAILVSIEIIPTSIVPILEKCVHLQV